MSEERVFLAEGTVSAKTLRRMFKKQHRDRCGWSNCLSENSKEARVSEGRM